MFNRKLCLSILCIEIIIYLSRLVLLIELTFTFSLERALHRIINVLLRIKILLIIMLDTRRNGDRTTITTISQVEFGARDTAKIIGKIRFYE